MLDLHAIAREKRDVANEELPGLAYLQARKALGEPITGHDLTRWKHADATVREARKMFPWGAGNIDLHIIRSEFESRFRMMVGRDYWDQLRLTTRERDSVLCAATALFIGGGNCEEFANVAAMLHVSKLEPGDTLKIVHSRAEDHYWVEVHHEGRPTLIIDPWSESPAHQAKDNDAHVKPHESHPDSGGVNNTECLLEMDPQEALRWHDNVMYVLDRIEPHRESLEQLVVERLQTSERDITTIGSLWPPTSEIHADVARAARNAMAPKALTAEQAAPILSSLASASADAQSDAEWHDGHAAVRQELKIAVDMVPPGHLKPSMARKAEDVLTIANNLTPVHRLITDQ